MTKVTQPLRDEHHAMHQRISVIRRVADQVSDVPGPEVATGVEEVYAFLSAELGPHALAEEAVLYPTVAEALGSVNATATMIADHVRLRGMTAELDTLRARLASGEPLPPDDVTALRRILYGLHALVTVHLMKEEEVYLPILDEYLSPEQARSMYAEMQRVEHEQPAESVAAS
jgi:iron-sulfur cluster repair protein YtfE (RIC family)